MQIICSNRHKDALILSSDVKMVGKLQRTILSIFTRLKGLLKMEGNDPSKKDEDEDEDGDTNQEKKDEKEEEEDQDLQEATDICPLSGNSKR